MAIATNHVAQQTGGIIFPPPFPTNPFIDPTYRHGNVETDLSSHFLAGQMVARIAEADGETPASIIDTNEAWHVDAYLKLTGSLVPMICGYLCFRLIGENIGPGGDDYEQMSDGDLVSLNPCGDGTYHAHFSVQPNAVHVEHCGTPYKLVVTATYLTSCPLKGVPPERHLADRLRPGAMAGMVTFPMALFIYEGVEL